MNKSAPTKRFSSRAEDYARYRSDYAPEAITRIFEISGLGAEAVVADIGAGTGLLTRHFLETGRKIYAVEPNPEMRTFAEADLSRYSNFVSLPGSAEETGLPDQSIDLIAAGRAFHWFQPEPARKEFLRILKPQGWIAMIWLKSRGTDLQEVFEAIRSAEHGFTPKDEGRPPFEPLPYYLGHDNIIVEEFSHPIRVDLETFWGEYRSYSHAPEPDHPLFPKFEQAVQDVFEQYQVDGLMHWELKTELYLGQI